MSQSALAVLHTKFHCSSWQTPEMYVQGHITLQSVNQLAQTCVRYIWSWCWSCGSLQLKHYDKKVVNQTSRWPSMPVYVQGHITLQVVNWAAQNLSDSSYTSALDDHSSLLVTHERLWKTVHKYCNQCKCMSIAMAVQTVNLVVQTCALHVDHVFLVSLETGKNCGSSWLHNEVVHNTDQSARLSQPPVTPVHVYTIHSSFARDWTVL